MRKIVDVITEPEKVTEFLKEILNRVYDKLILVVSNPRNQILLLGLATIYVFFSFLTTDTYLALDKFDASNTITIISSNFGDMMQLLKYDANLPFFYILGHFIFKATGTYVYVQLLNFGFYIISLFIFYKIIKILTPASKYNVLVTSLFGLTPVLVYYTGFLRMYELALTMILLSIYCYLKLVVSGSSKYLYGVLCSGFVLSLLHLGMGPYILILIVSLIFYSLRSKKQLLFILCYTLVIGISFYAQLSTKGDWFDLVFVRSRFYLSHMTTDFYMFPAMVIFQYSSITSQVLIYFMFVASIVYSIKSKLYLDPKMLIVHICTGLFLVVQVTFKEFNSNRHYIYFAVTTILFIYYTFMKSNLHKNKLYTGILVGVFFYAVVTSIYLERHYSSLNLNTCNFLRNIENSVIVTDLGYYNFVEHCQGKNNEVAIYFRDIVRLRSSSTRMDISLLQAKSGGNIDFTLDAYNIIDYLKYSPKPIKSLVDVSGKEIILVDSVAKGMTLNAYEHKILEGCYPTRIDDPYAPVYNCSGFQNSN